MAGSYVGLDIGSNLIKVLEARGGNGRLEVTALGVENTPREAFDNGVILDAKLLGQTVKQLMKKAGISSSQTVSAAASTASVVVRVVDMPPVNDSELAEQIRWETERQVPFPMSDVVMDYQKIERPEGDGGGQNIEVLLAVAQQEFIDQHVEVLQAAGLKPKYIDVVPLAAGRALLDIGPESSQPAGHTVVVVNIGAASTEIGIFRDKLIAYPRSVAMGGENMTRAIADAMQVDMETAEKYKCDLGEVMFDQAAMHTSGDQAGFADFSSGGFMDFGSSPSGPTSPSGSTSPSGPMSGPMGTPSGRMPFDFSNPTPPGSAETPETPPATPFDFSAGGSQETPPADTQEAALPAHSEGAQNLPVHVPQPADAQNEQLRVQVFNAIAPMVSELLQEIRRSVEYYRSRIGDAPVHEMLLIGGGSKLKRLDEFIQAEMGIPTRIANPLQNVQVSSKNYSHDYLMEIAPLFPVSLGLAAYDLIGAPAAARKRKK